MQTLMSELIIEDNWRIVLLFTERGRGGGGRALDLFRFRGV